MFSLLARGALRGVLARPTFSVTALPTRAFAASALALLPAASATPRGTSAAGGAKGGKAAAGRVAKATTVKATIKPKASVTKAKAAPKTAAAKPKPKAKATAKPKATTKKVLPPKLTAADRPPKAPATAWLLFCTKYRAGEPRSTSLAEAQATTKRAAEVWRVLSAHEKQAFADEFAEARKRYVVERAEWERTVTPQRLRLLNAQRAKKGKSRVRVRKAPEDRKPITSFSRFLIEYRKNNTEEGKPSLVTSAAAKAWRGMADAEKQLYVDAFHRDQAVWREKQAKAALASA